MNNLFDLSDELVLMTGGTGTIGLAFGEALLNAGARLVLWSRGKTVPMEEIVEALAEKTGAKDRIFAFKVDVSDKNSAQEGLERVVREVGVPTVLINGAGGNRGKSAFIEADLEVFEEVLKLNLLGGLMIPTQVVARYWIENNREGSIINVASATSFLPLSGVWAYNAAKSAVLNLTQGAAKESCPPRHPGERNCPGLFHRPSESGSPLQGLREGRTFRPGTGHHRSHPLQPVRRSRGSFRYGGFPGRP